MLGVFFSFPKFPFYRNKDTATYSHKYPGAHNISLALADCYEKISDLSGAALVFIRRNSYESYFHFFCGQAGV